jgi:tetratricopeptide (TPR) repeat protein
MPAAIELLEKGIAENPTEWRLYQDIGFIHWQAGDYQKASEYYERGGEIEGAAWWMRDLGGVMKIKGGSREVARKIYSQYLESEDENIRNQATLRLRQLNMLDELDAINSLLILYREQTGSCPSSLRVLAPRLQSMGFTLNDGREPIDPHEFPYVLDSAKCTAKQHDESTVPRS